MAMFVKINSTPKLTNNPVIHVLFFIAILLCIFIKIKGYEYLQMAAYALNLLPCHVNVFFGFKKLIFCFIKLGVFFKSSVVHLKFNTVFKIVIRFVVSFISSRQVEGYTSCFKSKYD